MNWRRSLRWTDTQIVAYSHNGVLLSTKKKWALDTQYTDECQKYYAEEKKQDGWAYIEQETLEVTNGISSANGQSD